MEETTDALASRLTEEELALIRTIGSNLTRIIEGRPVDLLEIPRYDELGILVNLVKRVARELGRSRRRDKQQKVELEHRLKEIERAHADQEQLLATIEELSSPVLTVHEGVLLVPLVGAVDSTRAERVMHRILARISETRSPVVILDVTGVPTIDAEVAELLLRTARTVALLGAKAILSGMSPAAARVAVDIGVDLSAMTPRGDLKDALATAIAMVARR